MSSLLTPFFVSSVFVLAVIILCFVKPNAGRMFLGFFYLAMALGVNGYFTFGNPQAYLDYTQGALIPFYARLTTTIVSINPVLFGLLVMAFEITMALLILYKQQAVKIGLIGTMLFLIGMAPLSWLQMPWLGLIIGELFLTRREFNRSVMDIIFRKNI